MPALDSRTVRVKGLRELQRAFKVVGKDISRDLRDALKEVAEPVRAEAEERAAAEIRNIGPDWSRMRIGVTRSVVYVAPRERSRRTRGNPLIARPNLAPLLMDRAMSPALEAHAGEIERKVGDTLEELANRWERI